MCPSASVGPHTELTDTTRVRRYAYFKKLTYFSTECIYSPDGG